MSGLLIKDDAEIVTHECDLCSLWANVGDCVAAYQQGNLSSAFWERKKKEHFVIRIRAGTQPEAGGTVGSRRT